MSRAATSFSIGELARRTECQVVTIRYYERVGMLLKPGRSSGGHRVYGPDHLERLAFIRRARELGFPLEAVRSLLALLERPPETSCAEVDRIAGAHLAQVQRKIADLRELERTLEAVLQRCDHTTLCECQILGALRLEPARPSV